MFCKKCGKQLNDGAKVCPNCGARVQSVSVVDVFSMYVWKNEGELNDSDCFAGRIPEDVKGNVRQNFGIDYSETVLFVRDTSFWNSRDQGLVVTDGGVYCIPDSDSPDDKIAFAWSVVKNVVYKDSVLYFWGYGDDTDYCQIHISYFMKHEDDGKARRLGNRLAQMFTQMAQCVEPEADPFDEALEHYNNLCDTGKDDEALNFALSCKGMDGMEAFCLFAGEQYFKKRDYDNAIAVIDEGLAKIEPQSPLAAWMYYEKYSCHILKDNYAEARKFVLPVIQNATDDMKHNNLPIRDEAKNDLETLDREYVAHFLEQPYNKRKVLLPVDSYTDLSQNHLSVIDIKKLDDSGISFPIGHPVAFQLYVGHPYVARKYLPFDGYDLELIEDKVREFCQLAQCLGATEISIDSLNSSASDQRSDTEQNVSGKVDYRVVSASGTAKRDARRRLMEEISQSISLHQTFKPTTRPYLPEGLVWYPNEPSWQRLYEQRMHGALQQHEERIETRKTRVLECTELNSIEGEFKNLLLTVNGHWDKKMEEKFEQQENAVLAIRVQFAPLDGLGQDTTPSATATVTKYTESEKEYIEELKSCLAEDGNISAGERRLLDKLRKHLGISEERAAEIEKSLTPVLTDEEKEYHDEYRLCIEDGGCISEGERRLLDKLSTRLGISRERVLEIEKMI